MRVVVTGGAGFIGANLCQSLSERPQIAEVVALDNLSTGRRSNLMHIEAELVEGSILQPELLDTVFKGTSVIVHLAARPSVPRSLADPLATHEANATGTVQVLEAARRQGVRQVILASSSSVYGANPVLPNSEDLLTAPISPYAASKLAAESYALAWARSFGLEVLVFRFFNVFGPLQPAGHAYAAVIPAFVEAALLGTPLVIHGDGNQTRDFTFVDSVTEVIGDTIVRRMASSTPVNLAFGGRASLLEVIDILEEIVGKSLPLKHVAPRRGDVRDSQADQSRLRTMFPDIIPTDLHDGLRRTVSWYLSAIGQKG